MHTLGKLMLASTAAKAASTWVPRYRDAREHHADVDQIAVAMVSIPAAAIGSGLSKQFGGSEKAWAIGGGLAAAFALDALLRRR